MRTSTAVASAELPTGTHADAPFGAGSLVSDATLICAACSVRFRRRGVRIPRGRPLAGLEHVPSGNFHANSAWLRCAVLAHNMIRWTAIAGKIRTDNKFVVARTFLTIPGRLVNLAGRPTMRMPTNWPWATSFCTALDALRELNPAIG